jgi:hypothetical protein
MGKYDILSREQSDLKIIFWVTYVIYVCQRKVYLLTEIV